MEERMSVDDILANWKAECGEVKTSRTGATYLVIPIADRRGHFLNLIQALISYGYEKEEVKSGILSTKIMKICWSDLITQMSAKDIKKSRDISRRQWEEAIVEFFAVPLPKYDGSKKVATPYKVEVKKEEKVLDLEPKDRIKMDVSDMADSPLDLEFLRELGIEESSINGNKK